jgi:hypothetical protein
MEGVIDGLAAEAGLLDEVYRFEAGEFPEEFAKRVVVRGADLVVLWEAALFFDRRWRRPVLNSLRGFPGLSWVGAEDVWQDVLVGLVESWRSDGFRDSGHWFRFLRRRCVWRIKAAWTRSRRRGIVESQWPVNAYGLPLDVADRVVVGVSDRSWWSVIEGARRSLGAKELAVFDEFCREAFSEVGARDSAIGLVVGGSAAAVNKAMQRVRRKLWRALFDAGCVSTGEAPRLGSGARIRAA